MKLSYYPPSNDPDMNLFLENYKANVEARIDENTDWCEQNFVTFNERFAKLDEILAGYKENVKKQEARIKKLETEIKKLKNNEENT